MTLRFVAIPLIAAICAGSPAMASPTTDGEQQVRGKGARDRGASRGGGDNQRYAVPRDRDASRTTGRRDNRPVIVSRNRPDINIHIGSSYRGQRYYSPFQYDRWARQYSSSTGTTRVSSMTSTARSSH